MTKKNKRTLRFKKIVKYYFPNGDEFPNNYFLYVLSIFFNIILFWIFYPIVYLTDEEYHHRKVIYYEEIKEKTK